MIQRLKVFSNLKQNVYIMPPALTDLRGFSVVHIRIPTQTPDNDTTNELKKYAYMYIILFVMNKTLESISQKSAIYQMA